MAHFAEVHSAEALAVLPLVVAVAVGVLLDTVVVRSPLVPALAYDIGPKVWWPGRLSRSRRAGDRAGAGVDRG